MSTLPAPLRRQLENTIKQARKIAEGGARKALAALAVHEPDPYRHMDEAQRDLRRKLRTQAKQLGDGESQTRRGAYEIKHLAEKLAYDQWHRILFARFLLDNSLLISPEHQVSVTLDDCEELAPSLGLKDAWSVAARFAAKELPEIFRVDDPAGAVELPVEDRNPLIEHVSGLPVEVFTASDSLGWCYQFWQAERKDEVNAAGNPIGADQLPAVTQLFTEDYMVDFLLDNTLGAWYASKILAAKDTLAQTARSEEELRNALALTGCTWKYLRFIKSKDGRWTPAAGKFDGWPKTVKELKCLDPCMGSGHFVVAMFERLVALRAAEEKLSEAAAALAVIRDNLFGLEIDPRCTQIGAFNLALAAWRRVGQCKLPAMNLACSGFAPNSKQEDWLKLAGDDAKLRNGMERLYQLFKDAPELGSLINPRLVANDMYVADYHELQPLLEKALENETKDDLAHEMAVTARGLAKAAEILADDFTLVATNVPYLGIGKQDETLKDYCDRVHRLAKADLATCFVERCLNSCSNGGSSALVTPQSWLFLKTYRRLRRKLLQEVQWDFPVRLGPNAFQGMNWWAATTALLSFTRRTPRPEHSFAALDVSSAKEPTDKGAAVLESEIVLVTQKRQLDSPSCPIVFENVEAEILLSGKVNSYYGSKPGQTARVTRYIWELPEISPSHWIPLESTPYRIGGYTGKAEVCLSSQEVKRQEITEFGVRGADAWGKRGFVVSRMNTLPVSIYCGQLFDDNTYALIPHNSADYLAVYAFLESDDYRKEVRKRNQKVAVDTQAMVQVPFDLACWQRAAAKKYPHGLPKPFSSDPTQWLFNGHPKASDQPLLVAVARLLGYKWPRQTGSSFPDCPAVGPDGLEDLADRDGIVCLSANKGAAPAGERLRVLLLQAMGKLDLSAVLASAGPKGSKSKTLQDWLRDEFFDQHCEIFHQRPFIWHIWDGQKSGFSALVNYHKLTHASLEKLTYAYLGDWLRRQQAAVDAGEAGSDARLQGARLLQSRLKLILEGEPPYDIFVRWKPLSKQAIGWHPDINDGVRMNIRPFAFADVLRKRVKIKWEKDRGKEPVRDKQDFPWFWGWDEQKQDFAGVGKEPDGNRWNDCHYSNEFKRGANKAR